MLLSVDFVCFLPQMQSGLLQNLLDDTGDNSARILLLRVNLN